MLNFRKNDYLLPHDTHTYLCVSGVTNVRFSDNLTCFVFIATTVLRFALLPYYRRDHILQFLYISFYYYGQHKITAEFSYCLEAFKVNVLLLSFFFSKKYFGIGLKLLMRMTSLKGMHDWWGLIFRTAIRTMRYNSESRKNVCINERTKLFLPSRHLPAQT